MKTLKTTFAFLAITLFASSISFISCIKKDEPVLTPTQAPEQNPLAGFLSSTGLNQVVTTIVNNADIETGYSFIPLTEGKIIAITVRVPESRSGIRVTIWDKMAGTSLRTEMIDAPSVGVESVKTITPLDLVKDREYIITMNTNDFYAYTKSNGSNINYPITVGDFKITDVNFRSGTSQAIPNGSLAGSYSGDCSFKFQK